MKESNTLNPSKKIILSFYTIMEERELYLDENFSDKSLASLCGCSLKELDRFFLEEFGLTAAGIISMYREQHC
jgi:AraC-like DNA-binding protein